MTVKIHGKDYSEVKDRIPLFWQKHPEGCINTDIVEVAPDYVVIKAFLYANQTDPRPLATGLAHELRTASKINQASYVENCETSAIGRALANYGMAGTSERPSAEEMQKAERTKGQLHNEIAELCRELGKEVDEVYTKSKAAWKKKELSLEDYQKILAGLKKQKGEKK